MYAMRRRAAVLGAAVLGAAVLGATAVAAGSLTGVADASGTPVVTAVKQQEQALKSVTKLSGLSNLKGNSKAAAAKDAAKITPVIAGLKHAATVVSQATATTAAQKQGQKDWVQGVDGLVTALTELRTAFIDEAHGNLTQAEAIAAKVPKALQAAEKIGTKGDKLLGIS